MMTVGKESQKSGYLLLRPSYGRLETKEKTMKCTACGVELEKGARFCLDCGTEVPQVKVCVKCGVELSPTAKFCSQCGAKQDGSSAKTLSMGDKNVVAGDVIGSKEETNIAGHATIFKNAQETQKSAEVIQESQESQKTEEVIQEPQKTKKSEIKAKLMASENIILDKARKLLYHLDRPYPALCLVEPLYQKYGETETVLEVYLSALAWCNPKKAMELAESLCSVEGYRVQIEDAIRRKDSLQAEQKLQEAKERWPEHIGLQLLEVVVKIALYRDYKEEAFLEEGRKILSAMSNPENSVERSWQYLLKAFLNNENETINVTSDAFVQNGLYWHVVSRFFFLLHGLKKMEKECEIACGVNSSTGMLYWGDKERFFTANSHGNEVEEKMYDSAGRLRQRWESSYDNQGNEVERKNYDSAGRLEKRCESSYDNQGNEVGWKEYDSAGHLVDEG